MILQDIINKLNRDMILDIIKEGYNTFKDKTNKYDMVTSLADLEFIEFTEITHLFEITITMFTHKDLRLTSSLVRLLENKFWSFENTSSDIKSIIEDFKAVLTRKQSEDAASYTKDILKLEDRDLKIGSKECSISIVNDIAPAFLFRSISSTDKSYYNNSDIEALFNNNKSLISYSQIYNADEQEIRMLCSMAYNLPFNIPLKDYMDMITNCVPFAYDSLNFQLFVYLNKQTICLNNNDILAILTDLKKTEIGTKSISSRVVTISVDLHDSENTIKLNIPDTIYNL